MNPEPGHQPETPPGRRISIDESIGITLAGFAAAGVGLTAEQREEIQKARTETGRLIAHLQALDGADPDLVTLILVGMFTAAPAKAVTAAAVLAVRAARLNPKET